MAIATNQSAQYKRQQTMRVTLIGALLDFVLGVSKIVVGILANSFALISDGVHSFSDLISDGFVLWVAGIAHEEPDADHPYGHGRFETIGTLVIGLVLFAVAVFILIDSVQRLQELGNLPIPAWPASVIALLSIVLKEWIYRYTLKVAQTIDSSLLVANAWHSRTDSLSSVAVLVGIVAAQYGFKWMDLVAAIFVALMILRIAWQLCWQSIKELVDTSIPEAQVLELEECILTIKGILGVHSLRNRLMGNRIVLDVHIQVDPRISVSEGHHIGDWVSQTLSKKFSNIAHVTVHIDSELDVDIPDIQAELLPLRHEVIGELQKCWRDLLADREIRNVTLHYLEQKVQVDLFFPCFNYQEDSQEQLGQENLLITLTEKCQHLPWLGKISFYQSCEKPAKGL